MKDPLSKRLNRGQLASDTCQPRNCWTPAVLAIVLTSGLNWSVRTYGQDEVERLTISTFDSSPVVKHQLVGGTLETRINLVRSMQGGKQISITSKSAESGKWGESTVKHSAALQVISKDDQEPRRFVVESIYAIGDDPAGEYAKGVFARLNEVAPASENEMKLEIERLVKRYGEADAHVLALPRTDNSSLEVPDTLRRLCRWIAYDRMFVELGLEKRPTETAQSIKTLYETVLNAVRSSTPPSDQSILSSQEFERIGKALEFQYTVSFSPQSDDERPDDRWRQAQRVSFREGHVGKAKWKGRLDSKGDPTAWLAVQSPDGVSKLKLRLPGSDARWMIVDAGGPWQFIRLVKTSTEASVTFEMDIESSAKSPSIELGDLDPPAASFPF